MSQASCKKEEAMTSRGYWLLCRSETHSKLCNLVECTQFSKQSALLPPPQQQVLHGVSRGAAHAGSHKYLVPREQPFRVWDTHGLYFSIHMVLFLLFNLKKANLKLALHHTVYHHQSYENNKHNYQHS
ncbi:protein E3A [Equid gammaherpesvirus 5]|nr:protein E3A [Equid gammaherpesvirus 5]